MNTKPKHVIGAARLMAHAVLMFVVGRSLFESAEMIMLRFLPLLHHAPEQNYWTAVVQVTVTMSWDVLNGSAELQHLVSELRKTWQDLLRLLSE